MKVCKISQADLEYLVREVVANRPSAHGVYDPIEFATKQTTNAIIQRARQAIQDASCGASEGELGVDFGYDGREELKK